MILKGYFFWNYTNRSSQSRCISSKINVHAAIIWCDVTCSWKCHFLAVIISPKWSCVTTHLEFRFSSPYNISRIVMQTWLTHLRNGRRSWFKLNASSNRPMSYYLLTEGQGRSYLGLSLLMRRELVISAAWSCSIFIACMCWTSFQTTCLSMHSKCSNTA